MKKYISILIGLLLLCFVSFGQTVVTKDSTSTTVNVRVLSNPNINVVDTSYSTSLNNYTEKNVEITKTLEQLGNEISLLRDAQLTKKQLVNNKGYPDSQIENYIIYNLWISIIVAIIMYCIFMIFGNKAFGDSFDHFIYYMLSFFIYGFIGLVSYYLITMIINPNYLILKNWLNLFG